MNMKKDICDILIDFEQKRTCTYHLYEINKDEYLTIVLSLLSWMSLEHKREQWKKEGRLTCSKPMKLNLEYPWCQQLYTLIEKEDIFNNYFVVKKKAVYFSDNVSEEERQNLCKKAFDWDTSNRKNIARR